MVLTQLTEDDREVMKERLVLRDQKTCKNLIQFYMSMKNIKLRGIYNYVWEYNEKVFFNVQIFK